MRSYTAASLSAPVSAAPAGAADRTRRTASPGIRAARPDLHARAAVLLFSMPFERERDKLVDERREREAAGRPHLRVHPDRREPGNRVHLVQIDDPRVAREQKVDARHAGAVDRLECRNRERLHLGHLLLAEVGGDHDPGAVLAGVEVLRLVVVELARRDHLARHGRLGIVVAEDRTFDFARFRHGRLDHDLAVELGRELDRRPQLRRVARLRDATLDPRFAGFTNTGKPSFETIVPIIPRSSRRQSRTRNAWYSQIGRAAALNIIFIAALSIPTADARTPAPTYGTFASSSNPWTVPSSPYGPCSTGKTTS